MLSKRKIAASALLESSLFRKIEDDHIIENDYIILQLTSSYEAPFLVLLDHEDHGW